MYICDRLRLVFILLIIFSVSDVYAQRASVSLNLSKDYQKRALVEKSASHYSIAESIYNQALSDNRLIESHRMSLVLNYVDLCFLRGDNSTAVKLLTDFNPSTKYQENRWIIRKAIAYSFIPDYNKADSLFIVASNIQDLDEDAKYEFLSYQGSMWIDRRNYSKALSFLDEAQSLPSTTVKQHWLLNLEKVIPLAYVGKLDEAGALVDSCIMWIRENLGTDHHSYIVSLRKKAEILLMQEKIQDAIAAFRQFFEEDKKFVKANFGSMEEQKRLDFWKTQKPYLSQIFALEGECPDFLLNVSLFRREIALLGNADSLDIVRRLDVSGAKLQKILKQNEVAIDFVCYPKRNDDGEELQYYGAIVVPSQSSKKGIEFVSLGKAHDFENYRLKGNRSLISAIRSNSINDKNILYNDPNLYKQIWYPLESYLKEVSEIYFVPDGILNLLGIENIKGTECLPNIHRLTSLARLHESNDSRFPSKKTNNNALLIGGLDYDKVDKTDAEDTNHDAYLYLSKVLANKGAMFKYLTNARAEVTAIDSLLPNSDVVHVESEELLKNTLESNTYNIIHLSTHGYALQVNVAPVPHALSDSLTEDKSLLASGVALSGANVAALQDNKEDGLLSARELCDINLKNVDLIVLSACQTALGEVSDEGPAGLIRGLKKGGANTIIASLWSVNDYSTSLFMKFFYEEFNKYGQKDKIKAITEAQRRLRDYPRKNYVEYFDPATKQNVINESEYTIDYPFRLPYYWAPFILIENI